MAGPSREGEILDGKFRIDRKLGEGGMGAVYAGEHTRLKKAVAIKVLHAGAAANAEMADRFEREAQAASQIGSDHIVEVFDIGVTPSGDRFMVMEYLDGEALRARLKRLKRLREVEIAEIAVQMLTGLQAAHEAGIVHRDLKPDNVFLCREKSGRRDFVKVLDFGISKFSQAGEAGSMTKTGTIMGSPNYMSPEHVQASHDVDARSDLYSVGVMLFEAVTGKLPRKAATFAEILFKVVYEPVPDPRTVDPNIDPAFAAIVTTACAHPREQRFQSAEQFRAALERYLGASASAPLVRAAPAGSAPDDDGDRTVALAPGSATPMPSSPGAISQPHLSGSQPSWTGSSHARSHASPAAGPPSASQPSFQPSSQPSFSGPSAVPGSSQPSFASGSQPSFAAPFSVTHQASGAAPSPSRRVGLGLLIGGAALAGVVGAAVLATQIPAAGTAGGTATSVAPASAPPSSVAPETMTEPSSSAVIADQAVAPSAEAAPSAPPVSVESASAGPEPRLPPAAGGKPGGPKPAGGIKAGY